MQILALILVGLLSLNGGLPTSASGQDVVSLGELEKNGGAKFGGWTIWRGDERDGAYYLIHGKSGLAVHLPWSSNGWIHYRQGDGAWHVLYSKGEPEKRERLNLKIAPYRDRTPMVDLQPGKYTFKEWTARVTKDQIEFHNTTFGDRMTVGADSGIVVHNGRTINGK